MKSRQFAVSYLLTGTAGTAHKSREQDHSITFNQVVLGSSPSGLTTNIKDLKPKRRLSERQKKKRRWPIKLACQLLSTSIPTGHNLFGFLHCRQTPP